MDQLSHLLTQIATVADNRCAALCSRLADELENDLLEYEQFPDSHFDFVLTLLLSSQYYSKPGVWNFLMAVNNAKDALSEQQYASLASAFTEKFSDYTDKDLSFTVCDFIARNYMIEHAEGLLQTLKQQELKKPRELQGDVEQGFYILSQEKKRAAQNATK
jgi:hypothetical protein